MNALAMDNAIEFRGLTKDYRTGFWGKKQRALNSLTLSVPRGSIFGFLGANGAGKTTGIKILLGLQFASAGGVKVFGVDPSEPKAKAQIGYLPERPYLHDSMSADAFLNFHRDLFGNALTGIKVPGNAELLELVGLRGVGGKKIKDFSKGMTQRIGIAQALVNDPELVILDEPMSGLDPAGRREVRDLILELARRGKTIFFSSHILSDVEHICHRFAFLERGVLSFEGSLSDIRTQASEAQELQFSLPRPAGQISSLLQGATAAGDISLLRCANRATGRAAIEEVWKLGGQVISFQAEQRSLEEFLFGKGSRNK